MTKFYIKKRSLFSLLLFITSIVLITLFSHIIFTFFIKENLDIYSKSISIVVYIFTGALGSLGLMKYWDAVSQKHEEVNWIKYNTLSEKFDDFIFNNKNIIIAFEWPHKFIKIESLCKNEGSYLENIHNKKDLKFNDNDIDIIMELDRYLDFFINLSFAIERKLMSCEDIKLFFHYYIKILNDAFLDEENTHFIRYINQYYHNVPLFLIKYRKEIGF